MVVIFTACSKTGSGPGFLPLSQFLCLTPDRFKGKYLAPCPMGLQQEYNIVHMRGLTGPDGFFSVLGEVSVALEGNVMALPRPVRCQLCYLIYSGKLSFPRMGKSNCK